MQGSAPSPHPAKWRTNWKPRENVHAPFGRVALYLVELGGADAAGAGLDAAAAGLAAVLSPPLAAFVSLPELLLSVFAPAAALGALPLLE